MQIGSLNNKEIIINYNDQKFKITPVTRNDCCHRISSQYLEYELLNPTFDDIKTAFNSYKLVKSKTLQLKENIFYSERYHSFILYSFIRNKFNDIENIDGNEHRIESKNDKFEYHIKYYTLSLSLENGFTKDGLTIFNENIFKVFKELDNETLLKLRDIFIEKDTKFVIDVYKSKDFDRNYKIFYKNECIEIKEKITYKSKIIKEYEDNKPGAVSW